MGKTEATLNKKFDVLDINETTVEDDLIEALNLINKEHIVSPLQQKEKKSFDLTVIKDELNIPDNISIQEKSDLELDHISKQADAAFQTLMGFVSEVSDKSIGDVASAAQSFLNIKLTSKLAKMEQRLKKEKLELEKRKLEAKGDVELEEDEDTITVLSPSQQS